MLDNHRSQLDQLCRVGGARFKNSAQKRPSTRYSVCQYRDELNQCFQLNVEHDDPDVLPSHFCSICSKVVLRYQSAVSNKRRSYEVSGGGCGRKTVQWQPHHEKCAVCSGEIAPRGRPLKAGKKCKLRGSHTACIGVSPSPEPASLQKSPDQTTSSSTGQQGNAHVEVSQSMEQATSPLQNEIDLSSDVFFASALPSCSFPEGGTKPSSTPIYCFEVWSMSTHM